MVYVYFIHKYDLIVKGKKKRLIHCQDAGLTVHLGV